MTPAKILIVEDDRIVARDLQLQLVQMGHTVVGSTARGEEAIPLVRQLRPQLVLMDICLDGPLDGIETAQEIRRTLQTPVIFLTAFADDETVRRASLTEPFGFLIKPFESSQLRTVVEIALYKHAADLRVRESERRYAATLSSIGDAVISTAPDGTISFLNGVAEELTGWPQEEALRQRLATVFRVAHQVNGEIIDMPTVSATPSGTSVTLADHTILIARGGRRLPVSVIYSPIIDDDGATSGTVLVFRDLTLKRRLEEELRSAQSELARSSRLTTMGELVVSIAHRINQPLAAMAANAGAGLNFLQQHPPDLAETRQILQDIQSDAARAGGVIKSMQALTRKEGPDFTPLNVDEVVRRVLALSRDEIQRHGIALQTSLTVDQILVLADRVQIEQLLLNLILNAIEATLGVADRVRELTITTWSSSIGSIMVQVEDNGVGIDPKHEEQLFESFFSTKPNGMGIGLSICRSIVETHGGHLSASARHEGGTAFRFDLPVADPAD